MDLGILAVVKRRVKLAESKGARINLETHFAKKDQLVEKINKSLAEKVRAITHFRKMQCMDGNWNWDEYSFGMANGLILAEAIVEDKEPELLKRPDEWLRDVFKKNDLVAGS